MTARASNALARTKTSGGSSAFSGGSRAAELRSITMPERSQPFWLLLCAMMMGCTASASITPNSPTSTCAPDSSVVCTDGSVGYSCPGADTPDETDSSLTCGAGVESGGLTDYCCIDVSFASSTCAADSSVQGCSGSSFGFSCTGTDTPDQTDSSLTCSTATPGNNGESLYCCIGFTSSTCSADSSVQGCTGSSFGFSCTGTDTPDQADSSLTCSTATAGDNGESLYCCTN